MKKLLIFTSISLVLTGCGNQESKTGSNPSKEVTSSLQVSSQSTTTATTTKIITTQKKADFVEGTYVGNAHGRSIEIVVDANGPVMEKPNGERFDMVISREDGYIRFSVKNSPTPEIGTPIIVVSAGKDLPRGMNAINPGDNDVSKERIYIPGMMNKGVVYVLR